MLRAMVIDCYFTPISPWAYLGHERLVAIASSEGAIVNLMPVDYGVIFPASGGLPLGKRAPQRQAYRLQELRRFSQWLNVPLNVQPKHFPVDGTAASHLLIACQVTAGPFATLKLAGAMMRAVWAEDRNLADAQTLGHLVRECDVPPEVLLRAAQADIAATYAGYTQQALEVGVFGAPTYVVGKEMFWGQDRLEFLERHLRSLPQ